MGSLDTTFRVDRMMRRKAWCVYYDKNDTQPEIYFDRQAAIKEVARLVDWPIRQRAYMRPATVFIHVRGKTPRKRKVKK